MWLPALKSSFYAHKIYHSLRIIEINGYKIHEIHWLPDGMSQLISLDITQSTEGLQLAIRHTMLRMYHDEI